jgi:VanZ family protein
MSSDNTSRIIGPVLRWLVPGISDEAVGMAQTVVRKSAHATEYFVLALLVWRARCRPALLGRPGWRWSEAVFVVLFVFGYAISDELHQCFVPTRQGSWVDVLIDTGGAVAAMTFVWIAYRIGSFKQVNQQNKT